jgi:hypothetical protein
MNRFDKPERRPKKSAVEWNTSTLCLNSEYQKTKLFRVPIVSAAKKDRRPHLLGLRLTGRGYSRRIGSIVMEIGGDHTKRKIEHAEGDAHKTENRVR